MNFDMIIGTILVLLMLKLAGPDFLQFRLKPVLARLDKNRGSVE